LDGTSLLPRPLTPAIRTIPAVDAIAAALLATERDTAWLIATGTLTNIAQLFTKYPELVRHLKGFSIMGGAVGDSFTAAPLGKVHANERFGNWTPYAGKLSGSFSKIGFQARILIKLEFNVVCDPEAAHIVFSNPELAAKATMIPLDVTHQVLATKDVQKLLLHGKGSLELTEQGVPTRKPSILRTMLVELLNFFAHTYAAVFGITAGPPLHDPLAVAVILNGIPEYEIPFYDYEEGQEGRQERYQVSVVTEGTHEEATRGEAQTGRTVVTLLEKGEPGVRIPRGLNVQRFWEVLEECLERAGDKVR
jgi:uridine nucleosidase